MSDVKVKSAKERIDMINARINGIDEKMKQLLLQKKDCEKQIKDIEEQEILKAVRGSGAKLDTLNDDLALVKILRENNLTKQDILELVSPSQASQAQTKNGGNLYENT